jgi:hypothetical protein
MVADRFLDAVIAPAKILKCGAIRVIAKDAATYVSGATNIGGFIPSTKTKITVYTEPIVAPGRFCDNDLAISRLPLQIAKAIAA